MDDMDKSDFKKLLGVIEQIGGCLLLSLSAGLFDGMPFASLGGLFTITAGLVFLGVGFFHRMSPS